MAKEKKDKKEKKGKLEDPVADASKRVSKKDKKDRKDKKDKKQQLLNTPDAAAALLDALIEKEGAGGEKKQKAEGTSDPVAASVAIADVVGTAKVLPASGLIVPFAQPLAEEKQAKKVLKCVKKGAKNKCLKRGVKEVVKALRKSPVGATGDGLVVLAADISPMDVISHLPVLCEEHGIPYIFVTSRAELGAAGATKRPTSVVMVMPGTAGKKGKEAAVEEGFKEAYDEAVKLVETAQRAVVY